MNFSPENRQIIESVGVKLPVANPVLDRNGHPTGEVMYNQDAIIEITIRGMGEILKRHQKTAREQAAPVIKAAQDETASTKRELERLREEHEALRDLHRIVKRANDEGRILARIGEAVEKASAERDLEIRTLKAELQQCTAERDDLRRQKRAWKKSK